MFNRRELAALQARKAELLRASAAQRAIVHAESQTVVTLASWVDLGLTAVEKAKALWQVATPLLRTWRGSPGNSPGLVSKVAQGVAIAQSLTALWRRWRSRAD